MMIDLPAIRTQFGALRENYENAQPFAHVALTDVFDRATLRTINAEFPTTEHMGGALPAKFRVGSSRNPIGKNLGQPPRTSYPRATADLFSRLWKNSPGYRA
jgi:hypothetical protein